MKKRIYSLLLSVMLVCMLCPIKAAAASSMGIKVIPEKETAQTGEAITFSVYACAIEHLICGQFELSVGEGLSYQENSAKLADGIREKLGAASVDWTEQTHMFTFYGDGDYSSTEDTLLMTFTCRVEAGVGETVTATVSEPEFADTSFAAYTMVVSAAPVEIVEGTALPAETVKSTEAPKQNIVTVITPATEGKNEQPVQGQSPQQGAADNAAQQGGTAAQEPQEGVTADKQPAQADGTVTDAGNSSETVPASAQNRAENGTSWWWLAVTVVAVAGIAAFVYFKSKREQK